MRVLVYGFGPYRHFRDNITARLIRAVPPRPGLTTAVFPVRFQRRQFVAVLNRHDPDLVLGLGQSSRKHLVVESRALNRRRARQSERSRRISFNGPAWLPTTLNIRAGRWVGRSRNAGDYVCNYSMYVLLEEIARKRRAVRLGFIHIPYNYDFEKAFRLLQRVLQQCGRSR